MLYTTCKYILQRRKSTTRLLFLFIYVCLTIRKNNTALKYAIQSLLIVVEVCYNTLMYTSINIRAANYQSEVQTEKGWDKPHIKQSPNFSYPHSLSAMKLGSSPWQRYSSHKDEEPQSFRSRKISSVKVDPEAPMKTLDNAHIVLSNIASTCKKIF